MATSGASTDGGLFDDDEWADNPFRQSTLIRELRKLQLGGDDLSRLDQGSSHQHLLPRFILGQFAVADDRTKRVFQLDTSSGASARPSVRDAATRSNFYTLEDEEGRRHTLLEGDLSLIDNHAAPALARLKAFTALYAHAVEIYVLAWTLLEGSGFITSDRGLAMFDPPRHSRGQEAALAALRTPRRQSP